MRFSLKQATSNESTGSYQKINHVKNRDVILPHLVVHWKDGQLYNRCTVFVWCLSGLEPKDVNAKVLKGGTTLCLRYAWPDPLQDALKLTRDAYCRDSSKVVEMETIFKQLKGGTSNSMISSEVEIELGMQVEEEFHNEVNTQGKVEKGNKLLRFFKTIYHNKMGKKEKIPIVVCKYEMLGIRDNYKTDTAVDSDYDDENESVFDFSPRSSNTISPTFIFPKAKKRKSPPNVRKSRGYSSSYENANAIHFASVAATNAEQHAARAASDVAAFTTSSHASAKNSFGGLAARGAVGGRSRNLQKRTSSDGHVYMQKGFGVVPNTLNVRTQSFVTAEDQEDYDDAHDEVENMNEDSDSQL